MADLFNKWRDGLARTRKMTFGRITNMLGASEITGETWDELEALMLQADMGLDTTHPILERLRMRRDEEGIYLASDLKQALREELLARLDPVPPVEFNHSPSVILIVGVNGSGKTTTVAKLGKKYAASGKKVLLVAADTFRAAAVDQLEVWANRLDLPVVSGQPNADPGAVAFDGIQSAAARKMDLVLVDTAGRLHTRYNLMEELKKVHRVAGKALEGAPHAVWLVLDATTGQNALSQARAFKDAVHVTGIILAKLDSSAKGGMAFAIQRELGLPILFAGLGEQPEDLQPFDRASFVDSVLGLN